MGRRAGREAAVGAGLGCLAGASAVGAGFAALGAAVAVGLHAYVLACAFVGLVLGSVSGAAGGALGGWSRVATGRPAPAARVAAASALAALAVLLLLWGPLWERWLALAAVLPGLWAGVALGDRAAAHSLRGGPDSDG